MKTPEEIKKGLECCAAQRDGRCEEYDECACCPYFAANPSVEDILALIQRLEDHIREVTKLVPKWISVEERLPDGSGEVLVVLHGCVVEAWYCGDGEFETGSGLVLRNDGVTHWMPLPEPPKED